MKRIHIALPLFIILSAKAGGQVVTPVPGSRSSGDQAAMSQADAPFVQMQGAELISLPRRLGARGMGDSAAGDDCEKIDEAIQQIAEGTAGGSRTVHLAGGNWRCKDTHYLILLPRDMGDYLNTYSGEGAQFSLKIVQGRIVSCDISGGSGYNPESYIIGQVIDYTHKGSGGAVYARADRNGVPQPGTCVVEQAGMRYPSMRDVNVVSFAQGADGAKATINLSQGRVSSAAMIPNGTSMPGGNGYSSLPLTFFPANFTCKTMPVIKLERGKVGLSKTAIAGISSTPGEGCSYRGSNSGEVPVFIGGSDSSGAKQATNIAPEPANVLPCAIQLRSGITLDGDGAFLEPDWTTGAYNLAASRAVFCDAYGDQTSNLAVRNITLSAIFGIWLSGSTRNFSLENVSGVYASPSSGNTFVIRKGAGGGLLFYAAQTGPGTYIHNIHTQSPGAVVIGGQWTARAGGSGLGSMGGYDVARGSMNRGGSYNGLVVDGLSQSPYENPPYPETNSYSSQLDAFFNRYVWKSQNSPLENQSAPNGTGACPDGESRQDREVEVYLRRGSIASTFYQCYRGVSDMLFVGIPRTTSVSKLVHLSHLNQSGGYRPAVLAALDQSHIEELSFTLGKPHVDPYLPTSTGKNLGFVELHDPDTDDKPGPSVILQDFDLPQSGTGFTSLYSITQGSTSKMENACTWGIAGVPNRC